MNTSEILGLLKSDQALGQVYTAVFPIDKLQNCPTVPAALVINLDPHNQPGSHWVALYIDVSHNCDYFDSFGNEPPEMIKHYIEKNFILRRFNKKCIQNFLTTTCGQLCIYFLVWRARGISMKQIVSSLEQSYADEYVTGFINTLFRTSTNVFDEDFILNNIYKS